MAFRHVSLLLALLAACCWLPAFIGSSKLGAPRPQLRSQAASGSSGSSGSTEAGTLKNPDFFWGNGFEEEDLEEAARKLSENTGSELWDRATFPPEDRHRMVLICQDVQELMEVMYVLIITYLLVVYGGFKHFFSPCCAQYMG
jgi:hypothetical protein